MGTIRNKSRAISISTNIKYKIKCIVYLSRQVKWTGYIVRYSCKLYKIASVCLDTFTDHSDQRTCNLAKHCGMVQVSCSAENSV
jgi:hypothetical protein